MEFKKAMEAEHCSLEGFDERFATMTGNTTWPSNEWAITVCGDVSHVLDCSSSSRHLQKIDDLMRRDVVIQAKLSEFEVIAVVLYTGPMVSRMQYCRILALISVSSSSLLRSVCFPGI
jgi:hypothetical protein